MSMLCKQLLTTDIFKMHKNEDDYHNISKHILYII